MEPARSFIRKFVLSDLDDLDDESFDIQFEQRPAGMDTIARTGHSALCDRRVQRPRPRQIVHCRSSSGRPVHQPCYRPVEKSSQPGSRAAADRSTQRERSYASDCLSKLSISPSSRLIS